MCGGPPYRKMLISDFPVARLPASASNFSNSANVKPPMAKPPIFKNSRRETPSQNCRWSPWNVNTIHALCLSCEKVELLSAHHAPSMRLYCGDFDDRINISIDRGSEFLQCSNQGPTPDYLHHQQQTLRAQLLRFAYRDATHIETGTRRWVCQNGRDRHTP